MSKAELNLLRYLNIEEKLNAFFKVFNYCFDPCIRLEISKNNGNPVSACCKDKYYKKYDLGVPACSLLKEERQKKYGTPESYSFSNPVSPCEYHNPFSGCVLPTHKSPVCLAFMCSDSIGELRNKYTIFGYDYLGMNYALEWILTGDFSDTDYYDLEQSIITMTETIINYKKED